MKAIKSKDGKLLGGAVALNVVGFVRYEDDRLAAATKQLRHLGIARVRASRCVDKKQDQVGSINGDARLVLHPDLNRVANGGLHAARIHHTKAHPIPFDDTDESIARRTGAILNDRTALANEAIEEGALPYVRSPNERNKWQATRQRLGFGLCLELVLTHAGAPLVIEVVRYCGVAAASRAARAMDAAFVRT
jgi:hypothetical protein